MVIPNYADFQYYAGTKLGSAWVTSQFHQIVDYLTKGTYDFNIATLITSGDVTIGGNLTVSGSISSPDTTPAGGIIMWPSTVIPSGWLLCDGTSYVAASYTNLFGVIGYTYGGLGANFNVPDFRAVFPFGGNAFLLPGQKGGSLTITSANLPPHAHSGTTDTEDAQHTHNVGVSSSGASTPGVVKGTSGSGNEITTDYENMLHRHPFTTGAGPGVNQNYYPPYLVMYFIIKI